MKSYRKELWLNVPERRAFINITPQVEEGLHHDFELFLEKLAPHEPIKQYRHNDTGEDNADAHIKRQLFGREVVAAVTKGKLDFGPWEQIFYGEFDGQLLEAPSTSATKPRQSGARGRSEKNHPRPRASAGVA